MHPTETRTPAQPTLVQQSRPPFRASNCHLNGTPCMCAGAGGREAEADGARLVAWAGAGKRGRACCRGKGWSRSSEAWLS